MSTLTFKDSELHQALHDTPLQPWSKCLSEAVNAQEHALKHGHLSQWENALASLPAPNSPCPFRISQGAVHIQCDVEPEQLKSAHSALLDLRPWRKGPFQFDSIAIDTEWRSDWKWERLEQRIQPLVGRTVLDVGCGNGYHLWRMKHAGASVVLGIDPSLLYLMQFYAAQRFIQLHEVQMLPLTMECMPSSMGCFDTVFSMGVLYHRRDPLEHLSALRQALDTNGELVLETLVIEGQSEHSLTIDNRYANMRNVYELPTVPRLQRWLQQSGFRDSQLVSKVQTSVTEQRSTPWMSSHSLADALDKFDAQLTVEGHPRPIRAILTANPDK